MMRHACGCYDLPDGATFLQLFHFLGTYSLIKPSRDSHVTERDLVRLLFNFNYLFDATDVSENFNNRLGLLLTTGSNSSIVANSEHQTYFQQNSPEIVIGFLAGFVAFRGQKLTKCIDCKNCLLFSKENEI